MPVSVDSVWKTLIDEQIVAGEDAAVLRRAFDDSPQAKQDVRGLLEWLVQSQMVTPYQAAGLAGDARRRLTAGPYQILERVNQGRLTGLFRARHAQLRVPVCLQLVNPNGAPAEIENQMLRLQREARVSVQLNHPNIVRMFQVGRIGQLYFLAFESLRGSSLLDLLDANSVMDTGTYSFAIDVWDLSRGQTNPEIVCRLIHDAALGLAHLHEQGVVHRNISPHNLWVTEDGRVKIMDFGLARDALSFLDEPRHPPLESQEEEEFVGTPDYTAPEQALDSGSVGPAADIYSLGCTLYHALTGNVPFSALTPSKTMILHAMQNATPPSRENRVVSPELDAIVLKMMAKRPADRYAAALEVAAALEPFARHGDHVLETQPSSEEFQSFLDWLNEQGPVLAPVE
ncbi:MAG TPA: serine/threonine-protein kinase [Pirellulales bacterium]